VKEVQLSEHGLNNVIYLSIFYNMKTIRLILVLYALVGVAYAQTPFRMRFPMLLSPSTIDTVLWKKPNNLIRIIDVECINPPALKPYLNTYHYTAFFCKMELKTIDYFGIYIKVHAGDYDAYTKEPYRTQ
jgi:hypothetical protein